MWIVFCQKHFGQRKRLKIPIRGCKRVKYRFNLFLFILFLSLRPYSIVWICVCHKKITHLDTFLIKLCSRSLQKNNFLVNISTKQTYFDQYWCHLKHQRLFHLAHQPCSPHPYTKYNYRVSRCHHFISPKKSLFLPFW